MRWQLSGVDEARSGPTRNPRQSPHRQELAGAGSADRPLLTLGTQFAGPRAGETPGYRFGFAV